MIYELSSRLQTNDFADISTTRLLVNDLEHDFETARSAGCALCILSHHALDEEASIFPEASRFADRLVRELIEEHHELTRRELALVQAGHAIVDSPAPGDRIGAGIALNQSANELFAVYITHMNKEETELVPLLRRNMTDAQQVAIRGAVIGRMPPDRLFALLGWMLPSLNVTELSGLLASVRPAMPPAAFMAITNLCSAKVNPAIWNETKVRVGI